MDIPISAVLPLLLSVPAFVAYRHPEAYRGLASGFFVTAILAIIGLGTWDFAVHKMFHTIYPYLDKTKIEAAEKAANTLYVVNWNLFVGCFCLFAYLGFLELLPKMGIVAPDALKKEPASDEVGSAPQSAPTQK
jgi:hypothetical protein